MRISPYFFAGGGGGGGGGVTDGDKGDITISGAGTVYTIDNGVVTFAKMQAITDQRLLGAQGGTTVEEISIGAGLSLAANALSSTITQYTDELAQDAVGTILTDTGEVNFTYNDAGPSITADLINNSVALARLVNATAQFNLIGRSTAAAGAWEQKATSSDVFTMLGSADNAAILSNIGAVPRVTPGTLTNTLTVDANGGFLGLVIFEDDPSSIGPVIRLTNDSPSPAVSDNLGTLQFFGRNNAAGVINYGSTAFVLIDPTAGSEDSEFRVLTIGAGTLSDRFRVGAGVYNNGVAGLDKGAGTLNFTSLFQNNVQVATLGANLFTAAQETSVDTTYAETLRRVNAGATGVYYRALHDSASPTAADVLGGLAVWGRDGAANEQEYVTYTGIILDATSTSEDAAGAISAVTAGSLTEIARFDGTAGFSMFGANPVVDNNRLLVMRQYTTATLPAAPADGKWAFDSDTNQPKYSNGGAWQALPGGGSSLAFQEEGVGVLSSGTANFVGAGVTVTDVGGTATITVSGGSFDYGMHLAMSTQFFTN